MYLSRLYIENYRSIKKLDLKFEKGKNIIVGKNNSGKSNIIKAIDLILGERSPTWIKSDIISDHDFYKGILEMKNSASAPTSSSDPANPVGGPNP